MLHFRIIFICWVFCFFPVIGLTADQFDPILFEKHIRLVHASKESNYIVQLEKLFAKAKNEGASIETVLSISRKVGISHSDIMGAAVKSYPAENVIPELIRNSRDAEEMIRIAVFLNIDPRKIITGAVAAGIKPVDAEVMVAVAMKRKKQQGAGEKPAEGDKSGLALTPGEELDNGANAAGAAGNTGESGGPAAGPAGGASNPSGGAAGPVGGSGTGRGVASPS
jgi:hypothetical protein